MENLEQMHRIDELHEVIKNCGPGFELNNQQLKDMISILSNSLITVY
jgi:hypothetical protein